MVTAPTRKPTLHDVANLAGVSKSTVSRVLTEDKYVSSEARRSIEDAMRTLGYSPNTMARSLRTMRTMTVGLSVPTFVNEVYAALAEGATNVLERTGRTLLVATSGVDGHREVEVIDQMMSRHVDGLMLALANERSVATRRRIAAIDRIPIVLIDREIGNNHWLDHVLVDHWVGVVAAAKDLRRHGHKRLAMLAPPQSIRPGREVAAAIRTVYPDARVDHVPLTFSAGKAAADSLTEGRRDKWPTAVIACGTTVLAGVIDSFHARNLDIPRDMSLIGYDASMLATLSSPRIATISRDIVGIGVATAELIVARLSGAVHQGRTIEVNSVYQPAGSVGPPRPSR
jgi:LacI family transcriptional regulator